MTNIKQVKKHPMLEHLKIKTKDPRFIDDEDDH
jgi:hypothetical protein